MPGFRWAACYPRPVAAAPEPPTMGHLAPLFGLTSVQGAP
jgi:hypothetical protein